MAEQQRTEGFAIVPNWLVRDGSVPARTKAVYLVLSSHTGRDGTWYMSHAQIALESGVSLASVKRSLVELRELGLVAWEQRQVNGGLVENAYRITVSQGSAHSERGVRSQGAEGPLMVSEQKEEPEEEPQEEPTPTVALRDDVERLCQRLADRIQANGARTPTVTARWRTAARLLLDRDGIQEEELNRVMDWATHDPFWQGNILSMPTFREKFDQLQIKSRTSGASSARSARDRAAWSEDWESGKAAADWEAVAGEGVR